MKEYIFKIIKFISSVFGLYSKSIESNYKDTFTESYFKLKSKNIDDLVSHMEIELEKDITNIEKRYLETGIVDVFSFNDSISKTIDVENKFCYNNKLLITINYFLDKTDITEESCATNIESYGAPKIQLNSEVLPSSHNYYGLKGGHQESIDSRANYRKRETSAFLGSNWGGGGGTSNTDFPADKLKGTDPDSFLKEILKTGLSIDESTINKYKKSIADISTSLSGRANEKDIYWPIWKYKDYFPPIEISAISGGKQFFYYNSERFLVKLNDSEKELKLDIDLSGCSYIKKCVIVIETCSKYFK